LTNEAVNFDGRKLSRDIIEDIFSPIEKGRLSNLRIRVEKSIKKLYIKKSLPSKHISEEKGSFIIF